MISHEWVYNGRNYKMYTVDDTCCLYQQWTKYNTFYEIGVLEAIKSLNLFGRAIDIGANVGNHAVYFAAECNLDVMAYEPSPDFYFCLCNNLLFNHVSAQVVAIPAAAVESPHPVTLHTGDQAPENTWVELSETGSIGVQLDTILPDVSLIKIDTEGTEMDILRGMSWLRTTKQRPWFCIEATLPEKYDEVSEYLGQFGYKDTMGNLCTSGEAPTYLFGVCK